MASSEGPPTADELLARRESLREQGILPTIEELCEGATDETRDEVSRTARRRSRRGTSY